MSSDNQPPVSVVISALVMIGAYLACYISVGFTCWDWIQPANIFSFLWFLMVWGIVGEFASVMVVGILFKIIEFLTTTPND